MKYEFWPLNFSENDGYYATRFKYTVICFKTYVIVLIIGSFVYVQYQFFIDDGKRKMPLVMW